MRFLFYSTLISLACSVITIQGQAQTAPFERDNNTTATYTETIQFYQQLAQRFPRYVRLTEAGPTDAPYPLHTAIISVDRLFDPAKARKAGNLILMINNAIHPGEPCGVDASMLFLRDYLQDPAKRELLRGITLVVIPFYNIDGGLNRGPFSRANQNGPAAYGFRGNARNYDLNRDFIKADSRNAQTFNQVYGVWRPHVFIDNHTSNGADYQYAMTLIATQPDKLPALLRDYLRQELLPQLYKGMAQKGRDMTPYVNVDETPEKGIAGFLDLPRYSSGYAALHHAISFMPEAHMLKPYADRVLGTYALLEVMLNAVGKDRSRILALRQQAEDQCARQEEFPISWAPDRNREDSLWFKGYTARYRPSEVSGLERLYYDRSAPWEGFIPYRPYYQTTQTVKKPVAYIIPQAYQEVIERLRWNGITLHRLREAADIDVEYYSLEDYKTRTSAYEGHYPHYQVEVKPIQRTQHFQQGDYVIFVNQPGNRYIVETLEPQAPDSYFSWNFFDGVLMQKEYFSSYVFEDLAAAYLKDHPEIREELEQRRQQDPEFAKSARAQLDFVYRRSPYYEPTYLRYPVARLLRIDQKLPLD
ncbi:MAG: hypothetical protein H6555_10465 [Lewinellaceae bacterium]|nr:hypothetical protein [Lewinellaceae bacterium]